MNEGAASPEPGIEPGISARTCASLNESLSVECSEAKTRVRAVACGREVAPPCAHQGPEALPSVSPHSDLGKTEGGVQMSSRPKITKQPRRLEVVEGTWMSDSKLHWLATRKSAAVPCPFGERTRAQIEALDIHVGEKPGLPTLWQFGGPRGAGNFASNYEWLFGFESSIARDRFQRVLLTAPIEQARAEAGRVMSDPWIAKIKGVRS